MKTSSERIRVGTCLDRPILRLLLGFAAVAVLGPRGQAQPTNRVIVSGHVVNETNGRSLHMAHITVEGTTLDTFSDENGDYQIGVPADGQVRVTAAYTGLSPQTVTIRAAAGVAPRADFALTRGPIATKEGEPVKLDQFVVAENRELNNEAIAMNEQRYAAVIKNVASADEHGDIGESNFGEFIKFLPGVSVNYSGGVIPTDVSLRGFPASTARITMDGGELASAGVANTNRAFDLSTFQVVNNISRVEVLKTPTPDVPANMLGGTINLITKSAFERSRPQLTLRAYGTANTKSIGEEFPAPGLEKTTSGIQPAMDVSYMMPVTKNFGFTVSAAYNARYFQLPTSESTWDQTAYTLGTYQVYQAMQLRRAASGGLTFDWKLADRNLFSASINVSSSHVLSDTYFNRGTLGAGPTGGPTFSQSNGTRGSYNNTVQSFDRLDQSWFTNLKYRYTGVDWKVDASASYSPAVNHMRYIDKGGFQTVTATLATVVARFEGIGQNGHPGPTTMLATDAAGKPVDVYDSSNYLLTTANDARRSAMAAKTSAMVNVGRHFEAPLSWDFKTGLYVNREMRDQRLDPQAWTFLGPDLIANNADNRVGLYDFYANIYSAQDRPFGFPRSRFISPYKIWEYYKAHPEQFSLNSTAAYTGRVNGSIHLTETVSAGYIRGDLHLLNNRLWIVGGGRLERTRDEGEGPLNDVTATLQKDAQGKLLRNAQGRTVPISTDPFVTALLQFKDRGAHADRHYDNIYPSLNAIYNFKDNLIGRLAYARTIGRPDYNDITPGISVTTPDVAAPSITVNNTAIKPWTADAIDASLEYYFGNGGQTSIGAYRKNISNFIGTVALDATPERLADLGLTNDYIGYTINTSSNVGTAKISGFEFNYVQALTFLPAFARGFQVFANGTFNKLEGSQTADFTNFSKRNLNWGVSFTRPRFTAKLNWLNSGEIRGAFRAAPDIYFYTPSRTTLDASLEARISAHWAVYGTARNLTDSRVLRETRGSATPRYASNNRFLDIGSYVSAGIKAEF